MDRIYAAFIGRRPNYEEMVRENKILVMTTSLASELNVLAHTLYRIAKADRRTRDHTVNTLRRALVDIVAAFPVYRTYATAEGARSEDRRYIDWAIALARRRTHIADATVFDFIRSVLIGARAGGEDVRALAATFTGRFQQFTAPVMAKAVEDTSFYSYNRLVSLNEVGGDPRTFGMSLAVFHAASQDRARTWPHTMLATSTHDNKRSEDVRARLNVLSEMPPAWRLALRRWSRLNRRSRSLVAGEPAPCANDEYLLYQTLLGAWPLGAVDQPALDAFRGRIQACMLKAAREAKAHTSWINPNEPYEQALAAFIEAVLKSTERNPFLADFLPAQTRIARYGMFNSISQVLIKYASPGVPDLYQGNEVWDFSLVDPDNRRPVDYERRAQLLREMAAAPGGAHYARSLLDSMEDGRVKLYVTWKSLSLRARLPQLFEQGGYQPLLAAGERAEHVVAFARSHAGATVIALAPRLYYGLLEGSMDLLPLGAEIWRDTRLPLPEGVTALRDELTGRQLAAAPGDDGQPTLRLADILADFPVALLTAGGA
jgi:(1->4)-alpha-D-glucan 1-alpha-D-glucosylmutase